MLIRELFINEKEQYNNVVKHIIQSWEWGDAKEATGKKVFKYGFFDSTNMMDGFQLSLHPLPAPLNSWNIAYLPKCTLPNEDMLQSLKIFGEKHNCIYIKLEPNIYGPSKDPNVQNYLKSTREQLLSTRNVEVIQGKELFTKYNFLLDITKTDEQLLADMHEKTRYNIGLAQRKGVQVQERTDEDAFKVFLKLYFETTKRQGYYGHDEFYHRKIWETLRKNDMARLLISSYENVPTSAWLLTNFHNTLYYQYGGSTTKFRNVMSSNLIAWSAIQLGKRMGLTTLDLWGAMSSNPNPVDPWYGFHRFKEGYGPTHIEYLGTYDIVINPSMYKIYNQLDKYRTKWLKLKSKFR